VPHQVHQVSGILAVVDGEFARKPNIERVFAHQPGADGVKGAGPGQRVGHDAGLVAECLRCDALDPALHFGGGPAREGEQHHAAGIGAVDDQMSDAVRQRVGLAGTGTGDDQQRRRGVKGTVAMLDGAALLGVQFIEIGPGDVHVHDPYKA